jgi:hypothetical protein
MTLPGWGSRMFRTAESTDGTLLDGNRIHGFLSNHLSWSIHPSMNARAEQPAPSDTVYKKVYQMFLNSWMDCLAKECCRIPAHHIVACQHACQHGSCWNWVVVLPPCLCQVTGEGTNGYLYTFVQTSSKSRVLDTCRITVHVVVRTHEPYVY